MCRRRGVDVVPEQIGVGIGHHGVGRLVERRVGHVLKSERRQIAKDGQEFGVKVDPVDRNGIERLFQQIQLRGQVVVEEDRPAVQNGFVGSAAFTGNHAQRRQVRYREAASAGGV